MSHDHSNDSHSHDNHHDEHGNNHVFFDEGGVAAVGWIITLILLGVITWLVLAG